LVEPHKKAIVEALLFASHGLRINEICEKTKFSEEEVIAILNALKKEYELRNSSVEIVEEHGIWKMRIKSNFIDKVKEFAKPEIERAKMETLAVIAWKAPVKQSEVVKIRGNKAYEHIKELFEEGFISMQPFSRTFIITLTDRFFEYFNIQKGKEKHLLDKNEIIKMGSEEGDKNVETKKID
jgi:segregation and condensation protein B